MPLGEKKERKQLSAEERKVLKARQEELRRFAIKAKARQFYKMANMVAVVGAVGALLAFFRPFYVDVAETKRGDEMMRQVLETGRAFVSTRRTLVRSRVEEANLPQHLLALVPVGLMAVLVLFLVDLIDPLGGTFRILSIVFAMAASTVLTVVSKQTWGAGAAAQPGYWPGLYGLSLSFVILGFLFLAVGSLAAIPGSTRRLAERTRRGDDAEQDVGGNAPVDGSPEAPGGDLGSTETEGQETAEETGSAENGGRDDLPGGG